MVEKAMTKRRRVVSQDVLRDVAWLLCELRRGQCVTVPHHLASGLASRLRDVLRQCVCRCPAIAGKLCGGGARCLAGWLADAARPTRGIPLNRQRAIGESEKPYTVKGF